MSARSSGRRRQTGKLAFKPALFAGIAAAVVVSLVAILVMARLQAYVAPEAAQEVTRLRIIALLLGLLGGAVVAVIVYLQGAQLGSRLTDLSLSVAKLGRGNEVRVRVTGNDEITNLARSMQSLAVDLAGLSAGSDDQRGMAAAFDPQLREFRDAVLPQGLDALPTLELDAALSKGSRGGMDYFDAVSKDGRSVLFLVSAEGGSAAAAIAVRMARDEIHRALGTGAGSRKALSHANRVLHRHLPRGACARATLVEVEIEGDTASAKVYQAGGRVPVLLCARGELSEIEAEGLALGLDEGPVFEKGLRPQSLALASGMRIVVVNDAGYRSSELLDQVRQHAPKHTAPFMNMVLGAVEEDAGSEGLREDVVLCTVKKS